MANERDAIRKIKSAGPFSWVRCRCLVLAAGNAGVTVPERPQREWPADSAHLHRAAEAEFQVWCWFEADFLAVNQRARRKFVSRQLAEEDVELRRAQKLQHPRKPQRHDAAGAKHVNGFRVVAEKQRPAFPWPPPKALLPESELPVLDVRANVGFLQPVLVDRGRGLRRLNRIGIHESNGLAYGKRVRRTCGRMLKLSANVNRVLARVCISGKASRIVEPLLIGPSEIIDYRLAKVRAVRERRPGDLHSARVHGFQLHLAIRASLEDFLLFRKFRCQHPERTASHGRVECALLYAVFRFLHESRALEACPRAHSQKLVMDDTQCREPVQCGIHPAIQWHVG